MVFIPRQSWPGEHSRLAAPGEAGDLVCDLLLADLDQHAVLARAHYCPFVSLSNLSLLWSPGTFTTTKAYRNGLVVIVSLLIIKAVSLTVVKL